VEGVEFGLDSWTDNITGNAGRVDTDGAVIHSSDMTFDVDTFLVGAGLVAADSNAGGDEVALVGISLEANEIGAEHPLEDLLSTCITRVVSWYTLK